MSLAIKVSKLYYDHQRRAKKHRQHVTYTREQLKAWIEVLVSEPAPFCPYCGKRMNEENFSVDHSQPLARNGTWTLENLTVCCKPCNTAKGPLTRNEFMQLSELARSWPDCAARNLFGRLKAGGKSFAGTRGQHKRRHVNLAVNIAEAVRRNR